MLSIWDATERPDICSVSFQFCLASKQPLIRDHVHELSARWPPSTNSRSRHKTTNSSFNSAFTLATCRHTSCHTSCRTCRQCERTQTQVAQLVAESFQTGDMCGDNSACSGDLWRMELTCARKCVGNLCGNKLLV